MTSYEKAYNTSWALLSGYHMTYFYVKACTDAHLAMSTIPGGRECGGAGRGGAGGRCDAG